MPEIIIAGVPHYQTPVDVYNKLADLRTQPTADNSTWTPAAVALVRGGVALFDGSYFVYTWNAASVAADDGGNVIKPTAIVGAGRWILMAGTIGGGVVVSFKAGNGDPENVQTGDVQGQTYLDLVSGAIYAFGGTPGTNIGWK